MHRIWNIHKPAVHKQEYLSRELDISPILAALLLNRGIESPQEALVFLKPQLSFLHDPALLPDMPLAIKRLEQARARKEKVMLFGDYDVDGLSAVAILETRLEKLGFLLLHYVPHRIKEGYSLNKEAIKFAVAKNVKLLITVDCGITSHEEIRELNRLGIDVIVTDHHQPSREDIPEALAVINPKRKDSQYPYKHLAGVGLAYKFAQCFMQDYLEDDLDLVLLGTLADMVPLNGENRILVKIGLRHFARTPRPGIRALMQAAALKSKNISTQTINFILAPRLNASGRVDSAIHSLELLLTGSEKRAKELAELLCLYNKERQKIEKNILEEAEDLIGKEINFKEHNVIVLAKEGWHQGVLGIVASKITDRFSRPTVVISLSDDLCKGSARSVKNFHIFDALCDCKELLASFGGHQHAAGLIIQKENIHKFKNRLNHLAKEKMLLEDLLPSLDVDMELSFLELNVELIEDILLLEPFGPANPEAVFLTKNLRLKGEPQILGRQTLKFWCSDGKLTYPAIAFGMAHLYDSLMRAKSFNLLYRPILDDWRDENSILLEVRDIQFLR